MTEGQWPGRTASDVATELREQLDRSLAELLPPGTKAALINYPNHHNAGDPALYFGGLRALARIGVRLTYRCDHESYDRDSLARELERGTEVILISGGGSLGDQYPPQQTRERALSDFPEVRTIQLPQSMWFVSPRNLDSFAEIVARHRDLTFLLRDAASLATARSHLDARVLLAPDLAFGHGPICRPVQPSVDTLWLRRSDREAARASIDAAASQGIEQLDWLEVPWQEALGDRVGLDLVRTQTALRRAMQSDPALWPSLARTFAPLARRRFHFGCRLLARGRVVVTDRLHGVILAVLMGIPTVAVDNANGKVGSFIRTWLDGVVGLRMAADHAEALAMARAYIAGGTAPRS
jgi:pyruvyl transferase EpsO